MRKYAAILILCFSLSLIRIPVYSDDVYFSKTYPLPITEMDDVISKWLGNWGFKILSKDQEDYQIRISAESQEEIWEVGLTQQSPLKTKVTIRQPNGGEIQSNRLNQLEGYISKYLNDSDIETKDDRKEFFSVYSNKTRPLENERSKYDKTPDVESPNIQQDVPSPLLPQEKCIVCVTALVDGKVYRASGFIINQNGLIISTAHDFKNLDSISVILYNGKEIPGRVLDMDSHRDLTLIQVDEKLGCSISLLTGRNKLKEGEKLFSMGCPVNQNDPVSPGLFTYGIPLGDLILWQVQMKIQHGQSGSPVFDENGNLVGIVTGRLRGNSSEGFLIPFGVLLEFVQEK